jgi:hypothetical protein
MTDTNIWLTAKQTMDFWAGNRHFPRTIPMAHSLLRRNNISLYFTFSQIPCILILTELEVYSQEGSHTIIFSNFGHIH